MSDAPLPSTPRSIDPRAQALERAINVAAAKEGGAVARRMAVVVDGVEEIGEDVVFDLRIVRSASFGRSEREFNVVARCPAASPETCRDKAMAALRAAARTE